MTLVVLGYGSQDQDRIAEWLLRCADHNESDAFELARQVVKHLRGANADANALEISTAFGANRRPEFS